MQILDLTKDAGLLDLNKVAPALKVLRASISWDMHPVHGSSLSQGFDLDLFSYVLNAQEKITAPSEVVYYKNKVFGDKAIVLPEDIRTGGTEYVDYRYSAIPATHKHVEVFASIFEANKRGQHFGMMSNGMIRLSAEDGTEVAAYRLLDYSGSTIIHIGRLTVGPMGWLFSPVGLAAVSDPNTVAESYL